MTGRGASPPTPEAPPPTAARPPTPPTTRTQDHEPAREQEGATEVPSPRPSNLRTEAGGDTAEDAPAVRAPGTTAPRPAPVDRDPPPGGPPPDAATTLEDLPGDLFGEEDAPHEDEPVRAWASATGSDAAASTPAEAPAAGGDDVFDAVQRLFPGRIVALEPLHPEAADGELADDGEASFAAAGPEPGAGDDEDDP